MNCESYHFFTVISNKTRWKIISSLYNKDKTVSEICKDINEEQSKVSHNLKTLADCNIVFSKRKGKYIIYTLNKKTIRPLVKHIEKHKQEFCKGTCALHIKGQKA